MGKITITDIIFEDFVNYKKPSMTLLFPYCSFKCDKENGINLCQNRLIKNLPKKEIEIQSILMQYLGNPITKSFVLQGLEPFDSGQEVLNLVASIRAVSPDDIVIYTGYTEEEIKNYIDELKKYPDIIIKFGRFRPNQKPHFDEILGVNLVSPNQYGKRIS